MKIEAGTVAVVTGGASGIGRSCVVEFARRGADVVVADINEERLAETVAEVAALGRRAVGVRCDVTSDADVTNLRDQALDTMGHVDLLMNNAGVAVLGPPERVPLDDWRWIFDVNVLGVVRGVQAFVPHMQERGSGHVITTASVAGLYAYSWDAIPYITSKFGAFGLTEGLYVYLKAQGIGVSVLCPGVIHTNLGENARLSGVPVGAPWFHMPEYMMSSGIEAEAVGPIVADAVEADQFLILTHEDDRPRHAERRADLDAALQRQVAEMPPAPRVW